MAENATNDRHAPVYDRLAAAGYPKEVLRDPATVQPGDLADGLVLVHVTHHGIERFLVDGDDLTDAMGSTIDKAVEFGSRGASQPIGFEEELGLLNDDEHLDRVVEELERYENPRLTYFVDPEHEAVAPEYDEREAVRVLGFFGSEGYMPGITADALVRGVGGTPDDDRRDDPDLPGATMERAPRVATEMAHALLGGSKGPDSSANGHKKRRRQRFHRNLDALREHVGIEQD